jgi:hypothetical protein
VVEIFAELPAAHQDVHIVMRGRDEPHIGEAVLHIAEPAEAFLLEHLQQLRLDLDVDVADLVEKQRAAMGKIEESLLRLHGSGERSALVSEQLRFEGDEALFEIRSSWPVNFINSAGCSLWPRLSSAPKG